MTNAPSQSSTSLPQLLAARARAASDGRLVADVCLGLIAMALAVVLRPPGWAVLAPLAVVIAAYGTWGIADRALPDAPSGMARAVRAIRTAAALIGVVAVTGAGLVVMAYALGNWIH
jgi:hypothetical protein